MSSNLINADAYLRTSREFPDEPEKLTQQINKSWVDLANAVNVRTIGLYPTVKSAITGEQWFLTANQKQQTLRRVYKFTAAGNILHGIDLFAIGGFTKCQGAYTDGTNWYGVIFASSNPIAGQVTFYITRNSVPGPTPLDGNIVITNSGAPAIQSGLIILEWLSFP